MNLVLSAAFVLCWSSGFIGAKLGAGSASALTLLMWRFLPLAVALLVIALVRSAAWRGLTARAVARQAVIGLLSQSGYLLTVYLAIQWGVSTGTTALIDGVQPLVAGALAGPLLGQAVSGRQWLGLGLGVAGVALVTAADATAGPEVAWWAFLVPFAGMLALVAATFLDRRSATPVDPLVALTIHCVTSAVAFTGLAGATGAARPPAEPAFWVAVAWLVALSTLGGYGLYWLVLRRFGVTRVNTLMFLMAPVTAVWGAAVFDEPFGPRTAVGLAVSLAAVVVVHRGEPTPARAGASPGGRGTRPVSAPRG
ncbi:DMT family transporter [Goodfellowiella coeruleoviolacea]|uniref:Permease of the drug/metabolite transporter (DMT) superfamily n=1 Tax=Goodfellowiella coeruleoviolacea TaxID=334858 RepID=A0AAE3GE58_9PSEU|nr:DMT family transporter [Goodfellowiella coeruleoviolacea]MCP2165659.1 Permease of the drug/metabolite transporter (DMT) superfamily [Goodfellowiella coeruleoviolacea]